MAADPREVLVWREHRLVPQPDEPGRLLVADSFLLHDGGVIAVEEHRDRFLRDLGRPEVVALTRSPLPPSLTTDASAFWDAAMDALPEEGAWFPRIELVATPGEAELRLRVRPAPPLTRTLTLATWTDADPRRVPGVKGPDLERLLAARAGVAAGGADDAVLLGADGWVADGTTSALLWWRGDLLCAPAPDLERVESVTAHAVLRLAGGAGVELRAEHARPEDLDGLEVWAVNALHGIRGVDRWIGGPTVTAQAGRLDRWRRRLEGERRPVRRIETGRTLP